MIPVALLGTGSIEPGRPVSNEEVAALMDPPVDPDSIVARAGIENRNWVEPDVRCAEMGAAALRRALDAAELEPGVLARIIFTSTTGGDWILPATANFVAAELGISGTCDCLDVYNACTAFLTSIDIAARCIATGSGPIAIVAVEKFSDMIEPTDPRTYPIFGDTAAAAVFGPAHGDEGVLGIHLANDGQLGATVHVGHPRWSGRWEPVVFGISNKEMVVGALALMQGSVDRALEQAGLRIDEVEWVLPHQPNGRMFDKLVEGFGVDPARTVPVVHRIGSSGVASVPVSLDHLVRTRPIRAGDHILMTGIGTGVSYGAIVLRVGDDIEKVRQ